VRTRNFCVSRTTLNQCATRIITHTTSDRRAKYKKSQCPDVARDRKVLVVSNQITCCVPNQHLFALINRWNIADSHGTDLTMRAVHSPAPIWRGTTQSKPVIGGLLHNDQYICFNTGLKHFSRSQLKLLDEPRRKPHRRLIEYSFAVGFSSYRSSVKVTGFPTMAFNFSARSKLKRVAVIKILRGRVEWKQWSILDYRRKNTA